MTPGRALNGGGNWRINGQPYRTGGGSGILDGRQREEAWALDRKTQRHLLR